MLGYKYFCDAFSFPYSIQSNQLKSSHYYNYLYNVLIEKQLHYP